MKDIKTVGIVGFGVMGAGIGLRAVMSGYHVVYKEISDELVQIMFKEKVIPELEKIHEAGQLSREEMARMLSRFSGTSRYEDLKSCDLVIEAAVEEMDLKIEIFRALSILCPRDTVLVSNTSTFMISQLIEKVDFPERTAGLHYFLPACVNRLIEVVCHDETSEQTFHTLINFTEKNQKVPIRVRDFPGFAITPLFIGCCSVLDSFISERVNALSLDDISREALNLESGIMWKQNQTGLKICYYTAEAMYRYLGESEMGFLPCPASLKNQFESETGWDLTHGSILMDETIRRMIRERLLGTLFCIAVHLVERHVVSVRDIERGTRIALGWPRGPFSMMNATGLRESARLIRLAIAPDGLKEPLKLRDGNLVPWTW